MTPEELEAMKKQIDQINAIDDPERFRPTADAIDKAAAEFATASYGSLPVRSKCFCGCHALVGAVSHPSIACCRPDDTWMCRFDVLGAA